VIFNLVRIVATKLKLGKKELDRVSTTALTDLLEVVPSSEQTSTSSPDHIDTAYYETTDRQLKGSLCLVNPTLDNRPLSPAFTFAGLKIEVGHLHESRARA
jgi:hypothetical protein